MQSVAISNRLLGRLTEADRDKVIGVGVSTEFGSGHVFAEPGQKPSHAYFLERGVVAGHVVLADGRLVGTMVFGSEGAINVAAPGPGEPSYARMTAQTPGRALRIELGRLRTLAAENPALSEMMLAYGAELNGELQKSVACNAVHGASQRLATWLLRCQDRVEGDVLPLKQEDFASLLGAQRSTINAAAQKLQAAGAVSYSRGRVLVLSREIVERLACECAAR